MFHCICYYLLALGYSRGGRQLRDEVRDGGLDRVPSQVVRVQLNNLRSTITTHVSQLI
jgi:hypothetical protein